MESSRDDLPVFQGELYLEYHRGTYTTQSDLKRNYRTAEKALQAQEAVRVVTGGKALTAEEELRITARTLTWGDQVG